jgi:hypothetical protein
MRRGSPGVGALSDNFDRNREFVISQDAKRWGVGRSGLTKEQSRHELGVPLDGCHPTMVLDGTFEGFFAEERRRYGLVPP